MSTRRQARECALQMLYTFDNCQMDEKSILKCFDEILPVEFSYREFAVIIFRGVCEYQKRIDSLIEKYADNWEIDRMATIDINIMRIAAYEMLYMKDTPVSVIIDEAVEIAKRFSNKDSSKFVNGILDKFKDER